MRLNELRIGVTPGINRIYAGTLHKDKQSWANRLDITQDSLAALQSLCTQPGNLNIVQDRQGQHWQITVREVRGIKPAGRKGKKLVEAKMPKRAGWLKRLWRRLRGEGVPIKLNKAPQKNVIKIRSCEAD